jgi:hypothetical protein
VLIIPSSWGSQRGVIYTPSRRVFCVSVLLRLDSKPAWCPAVPRPHPGVLKAFRIHPPLMSLSSQVFCKCSNLQFRQSSTFLSIFLNSGATFRSDQKEQRIGVIRSSCPPPLVEWMRRRTPLMGKPRTPFLAYCLLSRAADAAIDRSPHLWLPPTPAPASSPPT